MSYKKSCILCQREADISPIPHKSTYSVGCDTCGAYISEELSDAAIKTMSDEERSLISAFTRDLFEHDHAPAQLDLLVLGDEINKIKERYREKTVKDKLDNLIQYFERKSDYFGKPLEITSIHYPITYAKNIDEFNNILSLAHDFGYIERIDLSDQEHRDRLTWHGLLYAETIKREGPLSKNCFVAMSAKKELDEIYEEGIKKAIEEAGYTSVLIAKEEHNEKICDRIIAEIRSCKFLIADVTHQRQNVYYEAGFAFGMSRPVIFTCRDDQEKVCHFDTRQYNHIFWSDAADLRNKLANRIRATII